MISHASLKALEAEAIIKQSSSHVAMGIRKWKYLLLRRCRREAATWRDCEDFSSKERKKGRFNSEEKKIYLLQLRRKKRGTLDFAHRQAEHVQRSAGHLSVKVSVPKAHCFPALTHCICLLLTLSWWKDELRLTSTEDARDKGRQREKSKDQRRTSESSFLILAAWCEEGASIGGSEMRSLLSSVLLF